MRAVAMLILLAALAGCTTGPQVVSETPYSGPATRDDGTPVPAPTGGIR